MPGLPGCPARLVPGLRATAESGLLERLHHLLDGGLARVVGDARLGGIEVDFCCPYTRYGFECRPHSWGSPLGSGHAGDLEDDLLEGGYLLAGRGRRRGTDIAATAGR